ncbi:RNA polymerase, sigma 54 subunit, RpoN/SigL [Capnocytophaga haemolytica]|jgi:RNA polymerase sigma-54 factor|uniref:RNA polymerase factor sigma-54 n=1 Tax=Capnocytophaga haemolytica TaxID=45243 RepID=A0AAX2H0D8_9FLAO|nr:RNA polymerase factor sigma-54 [Capnocytophaga haemolytica]AMD84164.1 RNA polymerase sigma-54 factor [Capnocytophaga haemolytica]SFN93142.1 RNA polymerase, sigma 54 subunit, RpoN/SigL [Capnocytophaga haemolytica]SNV12969.1 RNA polymerase factor sigma-54 [Capnocytophaga haemolytica]
MLKQNLQLKLSQKLSPQQIQLMKLVQLPTLAFEQYVKQELEENPALESGKEEAEYDEFADEFDNTSDEYNDSDVIDMNDIDIDAYLSDDEIPDYRLHANNYSDDDDGHEVTFSAEVSFHQSLINQLNTFSLSDEDYIVAEFLVGSIDDSGYLRRSVQELTDDLAFSQNIYADETRVAQIREQVIFQLDPAGVGAFDLQECLLIQLRRKKPSETIDLAIQIITLAFEPFSKKHYSKLQQKFNVSDELLKDAIQEIERLNPKPGSSYSGSNVQVEQIVPDFTIKVVDNELELSLNGRNAPELHVSRDYTTMLDTYKHSKERTNSQKEAVFFIKQKLDSAKWFIDAIKQRQQTLLITMGAIMEAQRDYFLTGDEAKIKPLILKDIADKIGMDISTVSRVASSKYVTTPYGTRLIKDFFSEALKNDQGEDVSTREVKQILQKIISKEDKNNPLPDDVLVQMLKERGYLIARRTIAKYREQMDIPVARLRKIL